MRRCVTFLTFIALLCIPATVAHAREYAGGERPRVGLVLSGGGARGAAHVGVIKVLEELRIPVDCIAGTSMGSIVGGLYAVGYSSEELENIVTGMDWDDILNDDPPREEISFLRKRDDDEFLIDFELGFSDGRIKLPTGIVTGQKMNFLLKVLTLHTATVSSFDSLNIPFRAVATDIEHGTPFVLKRGNLAEAMRASMAVPAAFSPSEIDGRLLVDGGLSGNLPVEVARRMGADVIIAVNVGTPVMTRKEITSALDISLQSILVLSEENVTRSLRMLGREDVLIRPELGTISSADFNRATEAIPIGETAARRATEQLRRYRVSEEEYATFRSRQRAVSQQPIIVDNLQVIGTENVPPAIIIDRLQTRPGDTLDVEDLRRDLGRLYELGDFERVEFTLTRVEEQNLLIIHAREKSWGPNYLRLGMEAYNNFQGDSRFDFLIGYTQTWLNSLGAEWRHKVRIGTTRGLQSEFHQPLERTGTFFVAPKLIFEQRVEDIYQGPERVAQVETDIYAAAINTGIQFGRWGEFRAGYERAVGVPDIRIGYFPDMNLDHINWGAVTLKATVDQLDNLDFPRSGMRNHTRVHISSTSLGADSSYAKLTISGRRAVTYADFTMLLMGDVGIPLCTHIPGYDLYALGGFLNLSGYNTNQFTGQYMALYKMVFYHTIPGQTAPIYLGISAEAGNAWMERDDIRIDNLLIAGSAFIGIDTGIGPLFFGFGMGRPTSGSVYKDWDWSVYLKLGRIMETGRLYID